VYPRKNSESHELINHPKGKVIDAPLMEISSSFIREAIKKRKDVRFMMPDKVWEYIDEMNFYK
jgi:nicotinate-nucleotide adenylyltransferase